MAKTKTTEKMSDKTRRKASEKAQFERFVETARQIGVEEDPEALDRAFGKISPKRRNIGPKAAT